MNKRLPLILGVISLSTLGLILTQGYWLLQDYRYYRSQPLFSTKFNYYQPDSGAVILGEAVPDSLTGRLKEIRGSKKLTLPATGAFSEATTIAEPAILTPAPQIIGNAGIETSPNYGDHLLGFMPLAPTSYLMKKVEWQFGYSLLLIFVTTGSLIYMLRIIFQQRRMSAIKTEFVDTLMHELRTPLGTAQVAVEALKKYGVLEDRYRTQKYLDISGYELSHLSALIDRILDQSILESGKMEIQKCPVDVNRLIESVIYKYAGQENNINIQYDRKPGIQIINLDAVHISNSLSNLIENAIKYSLQEKRISISSRITTRQWQCSITDNGIGIDKRYHKKIFGRFFRVKDNRVESKGFGLGLSYVARIIRLHNGTIKLESTEAGSTFTVSIPIN
ncbi:sensor histidine kinase [Pedobacter sp. UBA5917]|jgi:signal transduction histidine kinase|uniref:sensor histidine kinase n=1 Tax=Pedobacter sp. UBA5917 TaxID=1947061 RepID=UPI0025EA75A8|nr:HAMP domain-containing sensor histidine kinase [Pedobacter sp. UBA5917]